MPRPLPPSDPSATVTDDGELGEQPTATSEMPQLASDTTGPTTALNPVEETTGSNPAVQSNTDTTSVNLLPAPVRRSKINHAAMPRRPDPAPVELSLLDVSDESTNPVRRQLLAAELAARATVAGVDEPDPGLAWRVWLSSPASKKWRLGGGAILAVFAACFLAFLFTPPDEPNQPPPARRLLRPDPSPGPNAARPVDLRPALLPQAPLFVDVEVDAGDGAVRLEKREAGVMKLVSTPPTEVSVNGRALGPTPVYLSAPVGRVEVLLESRELGIYKPVVVTLFPGQNPARSWDLAQGWLEVIAPKGSLVSVDGRALGAAPVAQLSLYEGFHRVEVVRPDKTHATSRVEVVPHFTLTHEILAQ